MWARRNLFASPVELPRSLEEGVCILPQLLDLLFAEKRLPACAALSVFDDVVLREIKEILTLWTSTTLRLLVHWRIYIDKNQSILKPLHHLLGIKRVSTDGAVRAFVLDITVLGRTNLVLNWSEAQSHVVTPSCTRSGK
jgi:hypothetical protein